MYGQLQILSQPWTFYTIPDGMDGEIFGVWVWGYSTLEAKLLTGTKMVRNIKGDKNL